MTDADTGVDLAKIDASDSQEWRALSYVDKIAFLKATVSMYDVVELFGLEMTSGDKIISPWNPDERTPSCAVYEDHIWDFSTGQGGDIVDLATLLTAQMKGSPLEPAERARVLDDLKNRSLRAGLEYGQVEQQKPRALADFTAQLADCEPVPEMFGFDVREFGVRRSAEGDILVPHTDDKGVYGVKVRYARGGKGSWAGSQFTHRLYAAPRVWSAGFQPAQQCVIVEGESDCWALSSVLGDQADVYALPSGAGSWKDHWLEDLRCYYKIHFCADNDATGIKARDRLIPKLGWGRTSRLDVPQLFNDARAAIENGWVPSL